MKLLLLMAGVLPTATPTAQQAPSAPGPGDTAPAFEVASVRRNRPTNMNRLPRTR